MDSQQVYRGNQRVWHSGRRFALRLSGVVCVLQRWLQLARERRQLAALSDAALKDLGLSRADIYQESERPFWDDPLNK